jgi:hypothetical protein
MKEKTMVALKQGNTINILLNGTSFVTVKNTFS